MLDEDARVTLVGGPYAGLDRFECRARIWADMQEAGLTIKEQPYLMSIPRTQRGGEIVEPMISTQWFVRIQPLAEAAMQAVKDGRIRILPERFEKVYFNWLENIKDWCISRQLWWGHRIPVWYCEACGRETCSRQDPTNCEQCGSPRIKQDEDVLDTWFSSGLWPFSTLGWPEETPDYKYFYPTTMMETGYDILFFWVARMIMDGLEFTGKVPFETVYLHGLIRDDAGRKMSKSYGNVIDPLIIMDDLGTDALRFTLLVGSTPGNDTNVSVKKVESNRNFANKIWNAGRFVLSAISALPKMENPEISTEWSLVDSWIWVRLQNLVREVERLFQSHQYGEAGRQIYEFIWNEFADWYLEAAKMQLGQGGARAFQTAGTLARVLDICLRLLHPFTPFVTEELWGHLRRALMASPLKSLTEGWPEALIIASWPEPRPLEAWEAAKMADFNQVQDLVRAIRNLRAENNVKANRRIPATLVAGDKTSLVREQAGLIASLAHLDFNNLDIHPVLDTKPEDCLVGVVGSVEVYLPMAGLADLEEDRARLEKELAQNLSQMERLETLLGSDFAGKAPEAVVTREREKLAGLRQTIQKIRAQLG
jgi:valyl-tRNA synthetase